LRSLFAEVPRFSSLPSMVANRELGKVRSACLAGILNLFLNLAIASDNP